jgi:Glycosyl hydrolases family 16
MHCTAPCVFRRTSSLVALALALSLVVAVPALARGIRPGHRHRPTTDTSPPTVPGNLTATAGNAQVSLSWTASTDNVGVMGYDVYRNGARVAQTAGIAFTNTGLTNGTSYGYSVAAYDAAGNVSAASAIVSATPEASVTTWDPSGVPMPTGNPSGWTQVFADNFANDNVPVGNWSGCSTGSGLAGSHCTGLPTAVDAKWFAYPDGWAGTPTTGTYEPSQVMSIQNGIMNYAIHTAGGVHMISAPEPKIPVSDGGWAGRLYGRYVIRARADSLPGYHLSFLLWPDSGVWPGDGEIDYPEADFNSNTINAFMHWQGGSSGSSQDVYGVSASFNQWHTYEIDWTSAACSFYIDGNLVGRSTANIPDTPMHLILQTGTSFGEATPADSTAGNVQIDWVTAYAPS